MSGDKILTGTDSLVIQDVCNSLAFWIISSGTSHYVSTILGFPGE